MPSFTHGKDALVLSNGYDVSGFLSSVTLAGEADVAEVSTLGNDDKAYIPGLRDATISVEGFYSGASGQIDELLEARLGTTTTWTVVFTPDAEGALAYGVRAVDTSYEIGAEIGGAVSISAEGQVTEGREAARVLHPLVLETTSDVGGGVDNTGSSPGGLAGYLHVTDVDGTLPTLDVKIQHSVDNSTWVDLATFTQVTTPNSYERVAVTGTVNRYLRVNFTIGGTTPEFTFHVAAARL
jgi:hypothetical protein